MPELLRRPAPRRPSGLAAILAGTGSREAQQWDGLRILANYHGIDCRSPQWGEQLALAVARDFIPYFRDPARGAGRPQRWNSYVQLMLCAHIEQGRARGLALEQIYEKLAGSPFYRGVTAESLRRRHTQARRRFRGSSMLDLALATVHGVPTEDFEREIDTAIRTAVFGKLERSVRAARRSVTRERVRRLARCRLDAARAEIHR